MPIYNNGASVPQLYCSLIGSMLYSDDFSGELFIGTVCIADVAFLSGVSGLIGSVDKTLTIRSYSDFVEYAREGYTLLGVVNCIVCWSFSPYEPFDMMNDVVDNGLWDDISTEITLLSGYPIGEIIRDYELSTDSALATLALHVFADGFSVNGSDSTTSDVAQIEDILSVPTPPVEPQSNFIDTSSVTRFGAWVGKIVPAVILVPLISFIGFTFVMSLLSLIKHA